MKIKSIVGIIALCIALQSIVGFGSQTPPAETGWLPQLTAAKNWVYTKWYDTFNKKALMEKASPITIGVGALAGTAGAIVAYSHIGKGELTTAQYLMLSAGIGVVTLSVLRNLINNAIDYYKVGTLTRAGAIKKVEDAIGALLSNEAAYPTNRTKLYALYRKNELFGRMIDDPSNIYDQACKNLIGKYKQQEPGTDEDKINAQIDKIQKHLEQYSYMTSEQKIVELGKIKDSDFAKAYMSEFLRLTNKRAVEQKRPELTEEQLKEVQEKIESDKLNIQQLTAKRHAEEQLGKKSIWQ